tara:strand:- start:812 stop:1120 length:309 start_codon:yes stop_codon:yes gene_type:complete
VSYDINCLVGGLEEKMEIIKKIIGFILIPLGILFCVLAFLQWLTFDYGDSSPLTSFGINPFNYIGQALNWLLVCIIGGFGALFLKIGASWTGLEKWYKSRKN